MKKCILLLSLICLFSVICGCENTNKNVLSLENKSLSPSMRNFLVEDSVSHSIGENFQFKVLSIAKVEFNKDGYDTSYSFYRYQILIAPLFEGALDIKNITFGVNDKLVDYYKDVPIGRNGLDDMQLGVDKMDIPKKYLPEELLAYRMDFTISNLGDDKQQESGLSSTDFDELMKTILITIEYNNKTETTIVDFTGELINHKNDKEYVEQNRPDLMELLENGRTTSFLAPYQDDFVELNR